MRLDLPYVKRIKARLADGSVKFYYYHKKTGRKIEGVPGTLEFHTSYEEAAKRAKQEAELFSHVIVEYFGSVSFTKKLSDRTRRDYLGHRKHIEAAWADTPIRILEDKRVKRNFMQWHADLVGRMGARQADLVLATTSRILSFAVQASILSQNHVLGLEKAYKADRSDAIWTVEDVSGFMKEANRPMKMALIMALHLGRREGDLIRITWGDYDGERIAVTNRKGGRKVRFPAKCTQMLRDTLDAAKRALGRIPHKDEPILTTITGQPWVESHFSTKFSATKNRAGLTHLHFHDLRGTAITVLAEHGSTNAQIASITGHSMKHIEKIIDTYMARTRSLNDEAVEKLERSWIASIGAIE